MQSWMMFELALRLRQETKLEKNPRADVTKTNKIIKYGQLVTIIFVIVHFLTFLGMIIYLLDEGIKWDIIMFKRKFSGYSFLAIAVLMGCANIFLFVQI